MGNEFIVTKTARSADNVCRAEAILLRPKNAGIKWTPAALHDALGIVGLDYTDEEVKELVDDLYKREIVEDVPESVAAPAPVPAPIPAPVEPVAPV